MYIQMQGQHKFSTDLNILNIFFTVAMINSVFLVPKFILEYYIYDTIAIKILVSILKV